jgi:hypothetical protein
MRKTILVVSGALFALILTMGVGCGDKPSCKLLYKRYKKCSEMPLSEDAFLARCNKTKNEKRTKAEIECSKKSKCDEFNQCISRTAGTEPSCKLLYARYRKCDKKPLNEKAFLELCEKRKDTDRVKAEIQCSGESECGAFKKCIKRARKEERLARVKERLKEALAKASVDSYSRAMTYCQILKGEIVGEMKKKCEALPAKATAALMKEFKAKRDKGEVSFKQVKCWHLKRYAKKAGPDKQKAAEALCQEIKATRSFNKAKEAVAKQMKKKQPRLPFYCNVKRVDKIKKLGTPYAKELSQKMIDLCYGKLGKAILQKKVSTQKQSCKVRRTYQAIKKYNVKGPEIDKLMKRASERCAKK